MAAQYFTVTIPTSPYIERFISAMYGPTIVINNSSTIGSFLLGVLQKNYIDHKLPPASLSTRLSFFTGKITCIAPLAAMHNIGFHLRPDQVLAINRHYENIFEEHLFFYVKNRIKENCRYQGRKQAIEQFAREYNIPVYETITIDCLIKMEYRFRKNLHKQSIPHLSTPAQPRLQIA